ncbi:YhgE/Pip domain-containing protein [Labedella populi]|uniref:YhgE/Pip domain-containing protein n=1 Tax=Labedella populi TaxID=2498850 RepID=A0A3S4CEV9_9MICO|nr:YhgE/Pip domain-containing protein [Labedella populi]RWZ68359.1 YhgE/Pip domain-containing protein [Labedella populi]
MSTPVSFLERAGSPRRIGWASIVGIILVPLVVAGILVWALWDPQDRLPQVTAAIVNADEPVEIDGQQVPLGRQLSAGLVSNDDPNYDWVITDEEDADAGLADGSYVAVVTIPENFSEAATSVGGDAEDAEQATIDVTTSDRTRLVDDALTATITSTAASLTGRELTTSYLENIYLGFNTLGDQLGEAADGAQQTAEGADELASGADELATGTAELATGADTLATGADGIASGARGLADGASQLNDGAQSLASGLRQIADGTAELPSQADADVLADGVSGLATAFPALVSAGAEGLRTQAQAARGFAETCDGSQEFCKRLDQYAAGLEAAVAEPVDGQVTQLVANASTIGAGAAGIVRNAPSLASGIAQSADGAAQVASGTAQLSSGASQLSSGATQYADGVDQYADGVRQLAGGTTTLAEGTGQLADGVGQLADGLDEAVDALPTYNESERENLASVVADPVAADGGGVDFGSKGAPFYAVLALWLGAFASFILLRAVPTTLVGSTRSSVGLVLRSFLPAGIAGAIQGVLVAGVLQFQLEFGIAEWFGFAGLLALTGVAFAAVMQALVAVFHGGGRFIAMIVALVTLATGIVATVPDALDAVFGFLPVAPAQEAIRAIAADTTGLAPAIVGLVLWTLAALIVSTIRVATERTVPARRFTPTAPATTASPTTA